MKSPAVKCSGLRQLAAQATLSDLLRLLDENIRVTGQRVRETLSLIGRKCWLLEQESRLLLHSEMMASQRPDHELHLAFVGGEKSAGGLLCRRYHRALTSFFQRRIPHLADDLVSAVFEVYVKKAKDIGTRNIRAFLFGVAYRKFLRALRDIARHPEAKLPDYSIAESIGPGISTIVGDRAEVRKLVQALQTLPNKQQAVLELILFEGLNTREASEVMGEPAPSCRRWKGKAVKTLREQLDTLNISVRDAANALFELNVLRQAGLAELYPEVDGAQLQQVCSDVAKSVES